MPVEVTTCRPIKSPRTRKALMDLAQSLTKESHIQETVVEFLKLDGWRAFRTELTVQRERGRVVGERGQPDYLFVRYEPRIRIGTQHTPQQVLEIRKEYGDCFGQVLWIEFKKAGEKPRADQIAWHEAERARGSLVLVVDDIDKFTTWYLASGLRRKI